MVLGSTNRNEYHRYVQVGKGVRCVGLQPYHLHASIVYKIRGPRPPGAQVCKGIVGIVIRLQDGRHVTHFPGGTSKF
jgi:hypothetical protein